MKIKKESCKYMCCKNTSGKGASKALLHFSTLWSAPFPNPCAFIWLTLPLGSLLWAKSCTDSFWSKMGPWPYCADVTEISGKWKHLSEGRLGLSAPKYWGPDQASLFESWVQIAPFVLLFFSSFPSLASCTAFKTKLWKIFKHLIWHQGKNSSADGRETARKKECFYSSSGLKI